MEIRSPKRSGADQTATAGWYPYYAGFSGTFASTVLSSVLADDGYRVLDPWNGSGTTTAQAALQGINCTGIDINPAMVVVAKARCTPRSEYPHLRPLADSILDAIRFHHFEGDDPLLAWFAPYAVSSIRSIEWAISHMLINRNSSNSGDLDIDSWSATACFFYLALFRTCRKLLRGHFSSNPNWLTRPKDEKARMAMRHSQILGVFRGELRAILPPSDRVSISCIGAAQPVLQTGTSESLPIESSSIDLVLSSPPYCTRIDYAVSTAAELAVLGFDDELQELRRRMMGTSTVPKHEIPQNPSWGATCNHFLDRVFLHPSKASSTYYYKNHLQYFNSLFRSLSEIERILKPTGVCCLVVQDSYYKDVHNDLPTVVVEMAGNLGLAQANRTDFEVKRTLAGVHPGVKDYRTSYSAVESVIRLSRA